MPNFAIRTQSIWKKSDKIFTAQHVLIATGGRPSHALGELPGAEHCITSNEAFHLKTLPKRIIVTGGGYIAVEFANIFHGLGCDVTLVCRRDKVLRGFDDDLRDCLTAEMHKRGIRVVTHRNFKKVDKRDGQIFAFTDHNEVIEADAMMLAVGRMPNTEKLGLEKAGVDIGKKGDVKVDPYSRTNVEHIYAIGDVTDRLQLTPVAIHGSHVLFPHVSHEGEKADASRSQTGADGGVQPSGNRNRRPDRSAGAGRGRTQHRRVQIQLPSAEAYAKSGRDTRSQFKLIVDSKTGKILGCHIFGFDAAEIIQIVAVTLKMGATKADFDSTIALHPSVMEELVTMRTKSYSKTP